jgi:hypothetical protein
MGVGLGLIGPGLGLMGPGLELESLMTLNSGTMRISQSSLAFVHELTASSWEFHLGREA